MQNNENSKEPEVELIKEKEEDINLLWEVLQDAKMKLIATREELKRIEVLAKCSNRVCPNCLTVSWAPASPHSARAIKHEELGWIVCQHCVLLDITTDTILKKHGS